MSYTGALAVVRGERERLIQELEAVDMVVDGYERLLRLRGGAPSVTLVEEPPLLLEAARESRSAQAAPEASSDSGLILEDRSARVKTMAAVRQAKLAMRREVPITGWKPGLSKAEQGRLLLAWRKERLLTQKAAADELGVAQSWVSVREAQLPPADREVSGRGRYGRGRPKTAASPSGSRSKAPGPTCADCGAPRSVGSGARCRKCWQAKCAAVRATTRPAPTPSWREPVGRPVEVLRAEPRPAIRPPLSRSETAVGPEGAYEAWDVLFDAVDYATFQRWFIRQDKPTKAAWQEHLEDERRMAGAARTFIPPDASEEEAMRCYDRWEIARRQQDPETFTTWFTAKVAELGYVPLLSQWEADHGKRKVAL